MKDLIITKTNVTALILSIAGLALSTHLWSFQVSDQIIPCTDNGCEHVLTSEYSKMFGVPLAVYGFFYYAFVAVFVIERFFISHKILDNLLYISVGWGLIYSAYLRYLEFAKIGSICMWCWMSVVIVLLLCIVCYLEIRKKKKVNF